MSNPAAPATVESQADPFTPGRTAYRVTSLYSPGAVQAAITDLMTGEDVAVSQFTDPKRVRAGVDLPARWESVGFVVRDAADPSVPLQAAE